MERGRIALTTRRWNRFKTWQLWNGLFNPPEHSAVFQRILRNSFPLPSFVQRILRVLNPIWRVIAPLVRIAIAFGALFVLPLGANLIGALFAYYVANFISRERERGTYDLLALTPAGEWDTTWTICLASVHRFNLVDHINFMRAMAILGVILLAFPSVGGGRNSIITLITAGIAVQIDAVQTIVIACLCGMLGHTYSASATNAGSWGAVLFLAAQIVVYIPVALVYSMTVFTSGLRYIDAGIVSSLIALVLLFALHELVIRGLWSLLRARLQ
ncbi:MAG TPA: hypothetical protein VK003_00445 [Oceanobacillus sp.]|nr:hypothetical protein [Oceanobacillus sp.]